MSYRIEFMAGTTDGSGDSVADSKPLLGYVEAVYVDGAALTDSANLTLKPVHRKVDGTTEAGESIVDHADVGNATIDKLYPRRFAQDNAGVDQVVATGQKVSERYFVPGVPLRATVSAGGATKAFGIWVIVDCGR